MACRNRPHPSMNRRDWMEKHIIYRRNQEEAIRKNWKETEKYFKNCEVECTKYSELSSPEYYQASMSAYQERRDKEANEQALNQRRKKLSTLLQTENKQYEEELKLLLSRRHGKGHFRSVPPPPLLGTVTAPVDTSKEKGVGSLSIVEDTPKLIAEVMANTSHQLEPTTITGLTTEASELPKGDDSNAGQRPVNNIMKDMRRTEQEASSLKRERLELTRCLNELREKGLQRGQLIKERRNFSWRTLMRPYKVQIQMRTRDSIESLELDLRFVNTLIVMLEMAGMEDKMLSTELGRVKSQILDDLWRENDILKESETLFQEEAERLWKCHVQEWEEDRAALDSLIIKAAQLIESKLQCKLAEILEREHGNIQDREVILEEMKSVRSSRQRSTGSPKTPVGLTAPKAMDSIECSRRLEFPESVSLPEVERLLL